MDKVLRYTLREEDLESTAGGLVNLILKNYIKVTGHEISRAKYTSGGIMADGRQVRVSDRIPAGTELVVTLPEDPEAVARIAPTQAPADQPLEILYEDEDLLIVNKPAGVVVHPSPGHHVDTMANYVAGYYAAKGIQTACRITGRLDKETSGVLVYALNRASAARLTTERAVDQMRRTYLAIVEGTFDEDHLAGTIEGNIDSIPGVLMKRQVTEDGSGRSAVTHYRVLGQGRIGRPDSGITENGRMMSSGAVSCNDAALDDVAGEAAAREQWISLLEFHIETGRTHQIRLHMSEMGHPLVGDMIYGTNAPAPRERLEQAEGPDGWLARNRREMAARQAACGMDAAGGLILPGGMPGRAMLHAVRMELVQPFTGEPVVARAPLPEDFRSLLEQAGITIELP